MAVNRVDEVDHHHHVVELERTDAVKLERQHNTDATSLLKTSHRIRLQQLPLQKEKLEPAHQQ